MPLGSLLVIGGAVAKLLLRANGLSSGADAIGDAQEGWTALRRLTGRPQEHEQVAERIAGQLKQRLNGVRDLDERQDLEATARDVAGLISSLADDDHALLVAATNPSQLRTYALAFNKHKGTQLRQQTSEDAEGFFDKILDATLEEYATLAPTSPRYQPTALTHILGTLEGVATDMRGVAAGVGRVEDRLGELLPPDPVTWPVKPVRAPDRATAYQHRANITIPTTGTVALSGATGHGKTQIAIDAYHSSHADLKLWASASTLDAVQAAYADVATALRLADNHVGIEDRARLFLAWLANPEGKTWLVVLDDLPHPNVLNGPAIGITDSASWWPPITPAGLTLVTTQSRLPALEGSGRTRRDVDIYTPDEAAAYLHNRLHPVLKQLGPDALADANGLAEDLAHHPLALAQAASVIHHDGTTTTEYRTLLAATTLAEALPSHALADDYPRTADAAYSLALDRALQANPDAYNLLLQYALLDPAGAPDSLNLNQRPVLRALHHLSLLTHQPNLGPRAVRTHPLTARLTREHATPNEHDDALRAAADNLVNVWPEIENDTALATVLRSNATIVLEHDRDHALWDQDRYTGAHPLWSLLGASLGEAGLLPRASAHLDRLHVLAEDVLGPDHPHTLANRNRMADWRGRAGDATGAVAAFEKLLTDQLRILGPDHRDTLNTRNNLAWWRGDAGDPAGAAAALEKLFEDQVRILGRGHPDTLKTLSRFAVCSGEAGDPIGAVAATEQLLADRLQILGSTHHDTLTTRHNLAYWRGRAGDPAGAAIAFQELLGDQLRILGPDHPETLNTRHNLARWRGQAGDPAGAANAIQELLPDRLRLLGPDHPETLVTRSELAHWRGEAGDPAGAVAVLEEVLADQLRTIGPDHPDTFLIRHGLADWRGEAGDPAGAASALEQLLADELRILGPSHPHTRNTRAAYRSWRAQARFGPGVWL